MEEIKEEIKLINPYIEKLLGEWFKNVILLILLIPTIIIIITGFSAK